MKLRIGGKNVEVRENLVDRAVAIFDPVRAQRRLQARVHMAMVGGYAGASKKRRSMSEWSTSRGATADVDLLPDLPVLRDRARDLVRNSPLAGGAISTVVTSVVGTGLKVQSQIDADALGMTPEAATAWQTAAEREFAIWRKECDITQCQVFEEIQDLVFRSTLESGDVLAVLPVLKRPGDTYGLKLQIVEADRVCNPNFTVDRATLAAGVEMDTFGAPIAWQVSRQIPGSIPTPMMQWDRIPAYGEQSGRRNALMLFKRERPGQTRGVPYLAPVIEPLKQLDRYTEAELMAAVVSGMFTVFVHSDGAGLNMADQQVPGRGPGPADKESEVKMGNGAIIDLGVNEKIETANPGRPNTAFDPFVQAILRQIGVRLELPFEVLIKHFTASYSAARGALLEAWRFFLVRRAWLVIKFCQPVWEAFLEEAISSGRLSAPGFFRDPLVRHAYCCAVWHGDGAGAIDPMKEALAAGERMSIGLTTLAQETAEYNGGDWGRNHVQQVKEHEARAAAGLLPAVVAPVQAMNPAGAAPEGGSDYEAAPGGGGAAKPQEKP